MCAKKQGLYDRKVTIRLKASEYDHLCAQWKKTTCRKFSEYARKQLLSKPITVTYRNASADAFLKEMIGLRKELSALGNNFNQAVHRLHTMSTSSEIKIWLMMQQTLERSFLEKTEEIRKRMNQIYEQWSHE